MVLCKNCEVNRYTERSCEDIVVQHCLRKKENMEIENSSKTCKQKKNVNSEEKILTVRKNDFR